MNPFWFLVVAETDEDMIQELTEEYMDKIQECGKNKVDPPKGTLVPRISDCSRRGGGEKKGVLGLELTFSHPSEFRSLARIPMKFDYRDTALL
ncbi:hypothetical protein Tco_0282934 [Tanacetum coccineum]